MADDKDGYLVAVLDGSVEHMYWMIFSWVLSMVKGLHLEDSFGGCDGRDSLLQAEAVGMLSISIFIALMAKHRNCTYIKIKYVSDNWELINRSKRHLNYNNLYPNTTLSAEYDITEQIYLTNKTYKIKSSFQHVYGCQDTKSRGEMSMEAIECSSRQISRRLPRPTRRI